MNRGRKGEGRGEGKEEGGGKGKEREWREVKVLITMESQDRRGDVE